MTTAVDVFTARLAWMMTQADGGYSQPHRLDVRRTRGVWDAGFTFEGDCSSCVLEAAYQAGLPTGSASYTGDMRGELAAAGWAVIPYAATGGDLDNLAPGDVLLSEAASGGVGHTGGLIPGGLVAEAWIDGQGDIGGSAWGDGPGDDTGGETRVVPFYSHPYTISGAWTHVLRPPVLDAADASAEPTPTRKGIPSMFGITYTANAFGGVTAYVLIHESAGADALDRVGAQVYNNVIGGFTEVPEHHAEAMIREAWERHNRVAARAAADVRVDIDEATARVLAAVKEGDNK
jgi:hypothetical protein